MAKVKKVPCSGATGVVTTAKEMWEILHAVASERSGGRNGGNVILHIPYNRREGWRDVNADPLREEVDRCLDAVVGLKWDSGCLFSGYGAECMQLDYRGHNSDRPYGQIRMYNGNPCSWSIGSAELLYLLRAGYNDN